MSWLSTIIGGEIVEPIKAVGGVFDELFTSDDERLSREEALTRLAQKPHLAQAAITKAEASHRSAFVAGWRPGIGWVAAISLFFYYVPQYATASVVWVMAIAASGWAAPLPAYPTDADGLLELVLALIGLGTLRTVEKMKGRAK
jgi:uncharacterized membrane protein